MKISREEVQHIAKLAKIKLTETEEQQMMEEFDTILGHFSSLENLQLDQEGIGASGESKATLRRDETQSFLDKTKLMKNVKVKRDGYIQVPKIIE